MSWPPPDVNPFSFLLFGLSVIFLSAAAGALILGGSIEAGRWIRRRIRSRRAKKTA